MSVNCVILTGVSTYYRKKITDDFTNEYPYTKLAGAYRVATELRNNGYSVQVIDITHNNTFGVFLKKVLPKFVGKNTLWIGISTNFFWEIFNYKYCETELEFENFKKTNPDYKKQIQNFINFCRELNPNIKFVVGGVRVFDFTEFDFFHFRGHTDQEIVDFTNSINHFPEKKISSVIMNREYKNFCTSNIKYTKFDVFPNEQFLPIEISRGCIFKCKFCSSPLIGKTKGDYIKNYNVLYDEFCYNYETFGITNYIFLDDTYNDNVEKMTNLYNKVFSRLPFKLSFTSYLRLDLLYRSPETVDLLIESGLKSASFGVETLDPVAAKLIGKGIEPMKLVEFVGNLKTTKFKNILTHTGWIIGFPTETKTSIKKFMDWVYSENNPFNDNGFKALRILPKEIKSKSLYQSEFDITFEKNGYEFNFENGKFYWNLKNSDLNQKWCSDIIADYLQMPNTRKNQRIAEFSYPTYLNLNISEKDLTDLTPREIDLKYDVKKLIKNQVMEYYRNLMSLPQQNNA